MSSSQPKPAGPSADLALVADFVNTFESELGTDFEGEEHLPDPDALEAWLRDHDIPLAGPIGDEDLESVIRFREALRRLLLVNNGAPVDLDAVRLVADAADGAALRVRVSADGAASLEAVGEGVTALVARLLGAIARAQEDGMWARLKACRASDCHWAFYDQSKNRSRTWCEMETCGNRAKTRSYRARRANRPS